VVNIVYGLGSGRLPMPALQNVVSDWPFALAIGVCLLLVVVFIATTMRKVSRLQADLKQLSEEVQRLAMEEQRHFLREIRKKDGKSKAA
jgi:hypothetical protein